MEGHKVDIIQDENSRTRVWIDGKEVKGIQGISYNNSVEFTPSVILEFIPSTLNLGGIDCGKESGDITIQVDGKNIIEMLKKNLNERIREGGIK